MIRVLIKMTVRDYWLEETIAWTMSGQQRVKGRHKRGERSWIVANLEIAQGYKDELESHYRDVTVTISGDN